MTFSWSWPRGILAVSGTAALVFGRGWLLPMIGLFAMFFGWASIIGIRPSTHWRAFNVSMRVVGLWFTLAGIASLSWALFGLFHADVVPPAQTLTGSFSVDAVIIGTLVASIGLLFLTRRAYRPDLVAISLGGRRSWWTGEPKEEGNR